MKLLVVGANGLVGSNVVAAGRARGWDVAGTYHSTAPEFDVPLVQFDLEEHAAFSDVLDRFDPDLVVNCAAMTDVDGCEVEPERAHVINGEAPGAMGGACEDRAIEFVHVSTDYVFEGRDAEGYLENDDPNPIQAYGESKLAGERAVSDTCEDALITRLSFVWGIHRGTNELTGFPAWVRGRLEAGESVPLFTDQWVTPTRAGHAAETILDLHDADASGLFHVACSSCVTPYEFGEAIADAIDARPALLAEGSMDDVDRAAERPRNTCLDVGKVDSTLDRSPPNLCEDVDRISGIFDQ